jgi:prepilin-type N-terminal cleavage/methylation domain-containing protein
MGFTLVELMVVVLIVGILVSIAVPVFRNVKQMARTRTCFANQRTIESAVAMWRVDADEPVSAIAGVVDASNGLMNPLFLKTPPRCPGAPPAANPMNPTTAEGAYTLDLDGSVLACTFGTPAHGSFLNP